MKQFVPALNGQPLLTDDFVFMQEALKESLTAIFKGFNSPNEYLIVSGCEVSLVSPGTYTVSDGLLYHFPTSQVMVVKGISTPSVINPADLAIDTLLLSILPEGLITDELGVLVNTYFEDSAFIYVDASGVLLSATPRLKDALVNLGLNGNQFVPNQTPVLLTEWSGVCVYFRHASGIVQVSGILSNAAITGVNANIFQLPVGFYNQTEPFSSFCADSTSAVLVRVDTSGYVQVDPTLTSSAVFLYLSLTLVPKA